MLDLAPSRFGAGLIKKSVPVYQGNSLVSLSGGRSSGMMLALLLEWNGGKLPYSYKVVFNNTGREHPKTLEFVDAISQRWDVPIVWTEFEAIEEGEVTFREVTYETASRKGEPFHRLFSYKNYLPDRGHRTCTEYMKVRTTHAYLEALQWRPGWNKLYGYRADELNRLHKAQMRCGRGKEPYIPAAPLAHAGINKDAVARFWSQQPFDLGLPDYLGNCDLCFLKSEKKLRKALFEMPEAFAFWDGLEHLLRKPDGSFQYILRDGGYAGLRKRMLEGVAPEENPFDAEELECNCTD